MTGQRADDLVQATLVRLYARWGRVRAAASHPDAYARAVLVRESIHERRSGWVKRVSLSGKVTDSPAASVDQDAVLDLRAAVAALPPRQRATLVLRFYCDLNVDQAAEIPRLLTGDGEEPDGPGAGGGAPRPRAGAGRRFRWPAGGGRGASDLPRRPRP
jgi:DNA-directed RNA polymerase specialized sigma24 family protein